MKTLTLSQGKCTVCTVSRLKLHSETSPPLVNVLISSDLISQKWVPCKGWKQLLNNPRRRMSTAQHQLPRIASTSLGREGSESSRSFCTCLCLLNPESHGFKEGIKQNEGYRHKVRHQTDMSDTHGQPRTCHSAHLPLTWN